MGWLKIGNKTDNDIRTLRSGLIANTDLKIETQHVEEVTLSVLTLNSTSLYPLVPISIADSDLPHIPMVSIAEHACGQDGILCKPSLHLLVNMPSSRTQFFLQPFPLIRLMLSSDI